MEGFFNLREIHAMGGESGSSKQGGSGHSGGTRQKGGEGKRGGSGSRSEGSGSGLTPLAGAYHRRLFYFCLLLPDLAQGLGGDGYDDFSEGRRDRGSRGESGVRSSRGARGGYSLGDAGSSGLTLLAGMVIGATLMYLLDPQQGGRRRALLRDKFIALSNDASDTLGKTSRDLRNRAQGVIAETTRALGLGQTGSEAGDTVGAQGESGAQAAGGSM
jgi:hypothetical protein